MKNNEVGIVQLGGRRERQWGQILVLLHLFSKSKLVETGSGNGISPTNYINCAQ